MANVLCMPISKVSSMLKCVQWPLQLYQVRQPKMVHAAAAEIFVGRRRKSAAIESTVDVLFVARFSSHSS